MSDPIAISVKNVSKNFRLPHQKTSSIKDIFVRPLQAVRGGRTIEVQHALKDISFDVKEGEFFGIVGRNGSGKSTLLKILAEIYQPTSGEVSVKGRLVPFIELGVGFNPELTGRENVYLSGALNGFSEKEIDEMYDDIVEFAELEPFMDQLLKNYSSGMQVRLAFSVATRSSADVLLIDEVLAVGDADFQRKCFNYFKSLKREGKTVVFVSHDMDAIREYCDRAALIDHNKLVKLDVSEVVANEYAKLFFKSSGISLDPKRWGNGAVQFYNVTASLSGDWLNIKAKIKVNRDTEVVCYGVHVRGLDGKDIVATNNRLASLPDIKTLKAGEGVDIAWEMLNIFSDGTYTITVTLVDANGEVYDWFDDAASITVNRAKRSVTSILPPLSANIIHTKGGSK